LTVPGARLAGPRVATMRARRALFMRFLGRFLALGRLKGSACRPSANESLLT
jgi:hypothetical protein